MEIKKEDSRNSSSEPAIGSRSSVSDQPKSTLVTAQSQESKPDPKVKKIKTKGWRIHNEVTYRGIDWLLNSTVGVAFAYWSSRTKMGETYFQKPVASFYKTILKPILKKPAALEEGAKWGANITGIIVGGFAIIPPVMYLENKKNKKKIVRWLDEKMYGKEKVENNTDFQECYDAIDHEPKKGFWMGMTTRFISLAPIIAAVTNPTVNEQLVKYLYNPVGGASKAVAEKMGIRPEKMLREGAMVHLDGNPNTPKQFQNNWDFLHQTIGFDFGLTFIYSFMHEITYKAMSALGFKQEETEDNTPVTASASSLSASISDSQEPASKRWLDGNDEALKTAQIAAHNSFSDLTRKPDETERQPAL